MNVGLPGTGVGGLFYLLLAVLIPLHELWRTARGRGSARGWLAAGVHTATVAAILAALWGQGWLLQNGIRWFAIHYGSDSAFEQLAGTALPGNAQLIAFASLLTLASLLILVHALGTIVGLRTARAEASRSPGSGY